MVSSHKEEENTAPKLTLRVLSVYTLVSEVAGMSCTGPGILVGIGGL